MVNNMKICRIKSGLTQRDAAKMLGTSVQTYNRWEKNPSVIQVSSAKKIAKLYGVSLDHLFFE